MLKVSRLSLLLFVIMLAGCPDSRESISDIIEINPADVAIRDDAERVTLEKDFAGAAFTTFSEQTSGLDIAVLETPALRCPSTAVSCEDWSFSVVTANPGHYEVEAYRDIGRTDLTTTRPSGKVRVAAFPRDNGSRAITAVGSHVVTGDSTRGFLTAIDSTGQLWSPLDAALFPEFQTAGGDDYSLGYPRLADNGELPIFSIIATNDLDYGAALTTDGRVFQWGARLAEWPTPLSPRPTVFAALEPLVQTRGDGVRIVSIALPTESRMGSTTPEATTTVAISGFGAALLSDGTVIVWDMLAETRGAFTPAAPYIAEGIDTAVAVSMKNGYLVALLADGSVVEMGRTSQEGTVEVIVASPTRVGLLQNVTAIAGRRALLADGSVYQWQPTIATGAVSTPVRIPGINNAVALPDPRQNVAQLADGSLVGWHFNPGDTAPSSAYSLNLGLIGEVADVAGDIVVDRACGRVWDASLTDHLTGQPVPFQATPSPILGFGGASNCDNGDFSHIVYFAVTGNGSGTISPPSGSISCTKDRFGKLCWWFGRADAPAVFTAVPDDGSSLRDWRWDCASSNEQSAPVALRQTGVENSQSLCKVTFIADAQVSPAQRTLTVQVSGDGIVTSNPAGIDCGADCVENYADGTDVTLTASASTGSQFDGWSDGCVQNSASAITTVSMNADKTCIANFSVVASGTTPPVARLAITPTSPVLTDSVVTFDGSASTDADGNILSWEWDFDGDQLIDASGEVVTFTYQTAGTRSVTLTVIDNDGLSSEATGTVDVVTPGLSQPPIALFVVQPNTTQTLGAVFTFDGSNSSDDIGIASWEWDFDRDGVTDATGAITTLTPTATGEFLISLRVTDTDGQVGTHNQLITVTPPASGNTYALRVVLTGPGRVDITPGAIMFPNGTCDGEECFVFDIVEGTDLTLDATAFTPAAFAGWSATECNSIPTPDRCVITVNSDRSVTATFQ